MFELPEMTIAVPAFVLFALQIFKKFKPFQGGKVKELLPLFAGLIGATAAFGYQLIFGSVIFETEAIGQLIVQGFILGLTACGTFSFAKGMFMGKTKPKADDFGERGDFE